MRWRGSTDLLPSALECNCPSVGLKDIGFRQRAGMKVASIDLHGEDRGLTVVTSNRFLGFRLWLTQPRWNGIGFRHATYGSLKAGRPERANWLR